MIAICGAFLSATVAYRYAVYKAAVGPEEEQDKELLKAGAVNGMAICRKDDPVSWFFRGLAVCIWLLMTYVLGEGWITLLYCLTVTCLLGLSLVDIRINELPPLLNLLIAVLGCIRVALDLEHWYLYIIGAVAVSGLLLLIGLLSKGRAMGGGDVKLMAALGLLLGWQKIILVLLLGAVLGTLIHGIRMIIFKDGHALAFGPYLAAGAMLTMLWGERMIGMYIDYVMQQIR